MCLDSCCYTFRCSEFWQVSRHRSNTVWEETCQIVCLKQICHQQGNESLMKLMLKDRLHFPLAPFCDASLPPGCKEEFSPTCWLESEMLTHSNTCRSGCVIFICLFMFFCQYICVYVWYSSTSLHTLWLSRICEAFEVWLLNIDTGVRVLFQGSIACWNWKK